MKGKCQKCVFKENNGNGYICKFWSDKLGTVIYLNESTLVIDSCKMTITKEQYDKILANYPLEDVKE